MSSIKRKLARQKAKNDGTFIYKKVLAKKFGCSLTELNNRLKQREINLNKLEENNDGEN